MKHLKGKIIAVLLILVAVAIAILTQETNEGKIVVACIVVGLALLVFVGYKLVKYMTSGYYKGTKESYIKVLFNGEKSLRYKIFKMFSKKLNGTKLCVCDVYMPMVGGKTAKADMIIFNEVGIWVIDVKKLGGALSGNEHDLKWKYKHGKETSEIESPVIWNKLYMKWLKSYFKSCSNATYFSYTIYSNNCNVKNVKIKSNDAVVTTIGGLNKELLIQLARVGTSLAESEMSIIFDKLKELKSEDFAKNITDIQGIQETIFFSTSKDDKFKDMLDNDIKADAPEEEDPKKKVTE